MNRREMFKRVAGVVGAVSVAGVETSGTPQPAVCGRMTPARWHAEGFYPNWCVRLDGVDITNRCRWFDDRTGEACVFMEDNPARSGLPSFIHRGRVEVLPLIV